jgi:hypothetical protein
MTSSKLQGMGSMLMQKCVMNGSIYKLLRVSCATLVSEFTVNGPNDTSRLGSMDYCIVIVATIASSPSGYGLAFKHASGNRSVKT